MGTVFGKNTTSSSITVAGHKVYYIDSTDAEIVEVQDGNNVKYNAFKYTLSGTPYWYVIDGEHDTWTDDLSEWGYSEVPAGPVLPVVTTTGDFGTVNYLTATASVGQYISLASGSVYRPYIDWTSSRPSYDSNKVYSVVSAYDNVGDNISPVSLGIVSSEGKLMWKNLGASTLLVKSTYVAVCSDSTANIVTVYNSSNNAYNAFKFTANNTDYYYVLDGTQTDWTDDLAGIGYSLYVKAWFTSDKSGKSIDTSYPGNSGLLYDSQGAFIAFQSGSTYTTAAVYNTSQQAVSGIDSSNFILEDNGGGYLSFKNRSSKSPTVLYVEYIVS